MSAEDETPTPEQQRAIELPADARAYVMAGPGAGKTWTLLRRARTLVERDEQDMSNILVLSFTRAVVRELRRRDGEMHRWATIFPNTFDSFATKLLGEHSHDDRWASRGYDARITLATQLVETGAADPTLTRYTHILVDEVQDLVGPRAEFVAALARRHDGGFTAFGDPAQAIYDHEGGGEGRSFSQQLVDDLADEHVLLTGNHRAKGELVELTERVRWALLHEEVDEGARIAEDAFLELVTVGAFEDLPDAIGDMSGDRAVLCRDNATALLLSRALHARGVEHRIRRGTADRPVAGWVGAVVGTSTRLARAAFIARLGELRKCEFPALPQEDAGWKILSRFDGNARGGPVRASEIGSKIAIGRAPFEVTDEPGHQLVISSVHRAKGLEFDGCVIVEWPRHEDQDVGLEARVLFVALSRARRDCVQADRRKKREPWYRAKDADGRFIKRGRRDWQTFGIEILGDDVHDADPGGSLLVQEEAAAVQQRLITQVRPGDAVWLEHAGVQDFGRGNRPVYGVHHEAGLLGITGARFGDALGRRLKGKNGPARIDQIRIDDLETVKGSADTGDAAGLGRSGLWLRPRLVGLGDFTWKAA